MKIAFIGAESTIFAERVIKDVWKSNKKDVQLCLAAYDTSEEGLQKSFAKLSALKANYGNNIVIETYLGQPQKASALADSNFVVEAIRIGEAYVRMQVFKSKDYPAQ